MAAILSNDVITKNFGSKIIILFPIIDTFGFNQFI